MNKEDVVRIVASVGLLISNYLVFTGIFTVPAFIMGAISFILLYPNGFESKTKPIEYLVYFAAGVTTIQVLYLLAAVLYV